MGMMSTSSLALLALGLGEILQRMGVLSVILSKMEIFIRSPRSLVLTTLATCLVTTVLTASQYIAILLPGQVMKEAYTKQGVEKRVLSRTLEDGGTIFTFLIPWSTTGIFVSGVLGVEVLQYAPYAFLAILCPLIAIFMLALGLPSLKKKQQSKKRLYEKTYGTAVRNFPWRPSLLYNGSTILRFHRREGTIESRHPIVII